jgi:NADPH:quinone reductase-like Zn-dependent oxidoreductase
MQSYWIKTVDDQTTLELRNTPRPVPQAHQILVRAHAAGLNRGEFIARHGLHGQSGLAQPLGYELAGEILQLGAEVERLKAGQRIMGYALGAFADYALMDAREAMPIPENVSWTDAASIPLTFMVVYDMLVMQGHMVPREWLLVAGISSGVGVAALQMAKAMGIKVIGTSGSQDKLELLRKHGLDVGLHTRKADFHDAVMQATGGKGADLAVNVVGGSMFAECLRSLAFEGRLATVGYVDGVMKSEVDIGTLHARRLALFGVSNKLRGSEQRAPMVARFIADILPMFATGRITPMVDRIFPFDRMADAKAHMDANRHVGKIVLAVAD